MKIALIGNTKNDIPDNNCPVDYYADFDSDTTFNAMAEALTLTGNKVIILAADGFLPGMLDYEKPDFCFNMAEGLSGDSREAQVPALLELLGIPYTGSRVLANGLALNKAMVKRVWKSCGLPVGNFIEFITGEEFILNAEYPMFVKPNLGGTSMGVYSTSLIHNMAELRTVTRKLIQDYKQSVIVEEWLPGREFTVTVIRDLTGNYGVLPIVELDSSTAITPGINGYNAKEIPLGKSGETKHICPADIPLELQVKISNLAIAAHCTIGCEDYSRVDLRMNKEGQPVLLEINPIPGLTDGLSDVCISAKTAGWTYDKLINQIFTLAVKRWNKE